MGNFINPGESAGPTFNPPFRTPAPAAIPMFDAALVRHGFITDIPDQKYKLNFLFNPSTIDINYEFTEEQLPNDLQTAIQQQAPNYVTGATCTFQLLFDRTEDYIYVRQHGNNAGPTGNQGVLLDVGVFENLVGIQEGGVISTKPVRIIFGAADSGGSTPQAPGGRGFTFDGTLIGASVTFTFFAYDMMPTRCVIACTFRRRVTRDDFALASSNISDLPGGLGGLSKSPLFPGGLGGSGSSISDLSGGLGGLSKSPLLPGGF